MYTSSLTDVYRSKLSVLHEEKRSLDELYEKAIMDYLVSDKAHEEIRRCYTELFCTTVLFTAIKGAKPIAFEEQYYCQYTWDPEKVNRYFGTYGPAVNRALSYIGKSINNASMLYDALQNDKEVLTIMILDDEFESYVQDEFDI